MKKFLYWCLIALFAVLVSTASSVALVSCNNPKVKGFMPKPVVSTADITCILDSIVNPEFTNVDDVFELRNKLCNDAYVDSIFISLSDDVLTNVSTVLIKRRGYCRKYEIVDEYLKNNNVYNNLPTPDNAASNANSSAENGYPASPKNIEQPTVTEAQPTRVDQQLVGSYKDTVIDGKKALIQH